MRNQDKEQYFDNFSAEACNLLTSKTISQLSIWVNN